MGFEISASVFNGTTTTFFPFHENHSPRCLVIPSFSSSSASMFLPSKCSPYFKHETRRLVVQNFKPHIRLHGAPPSEYYFPLVILFWFSSRYVLSFFLFLFFIICSIMCCIFHVQEMLLGIGLVFVYIMRGIWALLYFGSHTKIGRTEEYYKLAELFLMLCLLFYLLLCLKRDEFHVMRANNERSEWLCIFLLWCTWWF